LTTKIQKIFLDTLWLKNCF